MGMSLKYPRPKTFHFCFNGVVELGNDGAPGQHLPTIFREKRAHDFSIWKLAASFGGGTSVTPA